MFCVIVLYLMRNVPLAKVRAFIHRITEPWEWLCVFGTAGALACLVTHPGTSKWFCLVGGIIFWLPPFCIIPYIIIAFAIPMLCHAMTADMSAERIRVMDMKTYAPIVGWALYVSILAGRMWLEPSATTFAEVYAFRMNEIQQLGALDIGPTTLTFVLEPFSIGLWTVGPLDFGSFRFDGLHVPADTMQAMAVIAYAMIILIPPFPLFFWTRQRRKTQPYLETKEVECVD